MTQLRAVTFDATGTLFHPPRLGEIYSEVFGRHGAPVPAQEAETLVRRVWQEFDCRYSGASGHDRFSAHPGGARGWWSDFVARILSYLDSPAEPAFVSAELFDRFAKTTAWEIYPDVGPALEQLASSGVALAVVGNWDQRLPTLVEELFRGLFDQVICSAEVGFEKPHPAIFEAACQALRLLPGQCLHVGDRPVEDVEGARAAGLEALLLDRDGGGDLHSLVELPEVVQAQKEQQMPVLPSRG